MSLFLKNLPKSFFRTVVSSRPIFSKATSLFPSIARPSPKLPLLAVGKRHNRTICFGTPNEDKHYSTKAKKSKTIRSGPVNCSVNEGATECKVDCEQLQSKDEDATKKKKAPKHENEQKTNKYIPKYKKEESVSSRADVKAITGTWVSKKCIKFDFASCSKPKRDETTKPVKLEDQKPSKLYRACKKASSKELARKASQENKKVEKREDLESEKENEETTMKNKKAAQTTTEEKQHKKGCKPCTKKKPKKSAAKKTVSTRKKKSPTKSKKQKRVATKPKIEEEASKSQISQAANSSLIVSTYDKQMDEKSKEIIAKLKKELEDCRKNKLKKEGTCVEPPKLDSELPKPKESSKDVISGSKDLLKSVCVGIFKSKKKPEKSKSEPVMKKEKTEVKKSGSADCKIDLNPKYCERDTKEEVKKKHQDKKKSGKKIKKTDGTKEKQKADAKPEKSEKKKAAERSEKKRTRPKAPCSYTEPKTEKKDVKYEKSEETMEKKEKQKEKPSEDKKSGKTLPEDAKKKKSEVKLAVCKTKEEKQKQSQPSGPPDQSPIMQCIAYCKKKKQVDASQSAKSVPSKDKKPCSSEAKIYKKIASSDDAPKKPKKEEEEKNKGKDEIKLFVPCKYEEIKPGIRSVNQKPEERKVKKEIVPCKDEDVKKKMDGESADVKKDQEKGEESCPKFEFICPKCEKYKENEEQDKGAKKDDSN